MDFVSQIEPSTFNEALKDDQWILSTQEELNQFEINKFWELIPRPNDKYIIGIKCLFKNKLDENESNIGALRL